ncbi:hypothetical protein Pmani_001781 [Petrolisthes manimaculis]|uniref:Ionotropic glutamate receptor L-glutamate and glycine-binding domain-containing protein n=1 Tax=Petrolisthes manimaculis TaxID=1843537 RepID=A0AAE1URM6_9EUCA|nr:hypothetical protein Pmani_001781 [Petrolisthes manimaculis]
MAPRLTISAMYQIKRGCGYPPTDVIVKLKTPGLFKNRSQRRDRPENYNGHRFRIVEKDYFPYSSWVKVGQPKGGLGPEVRLQDSLGTRMINTVATYLNFTYIVREPVDGQWGLESEAGKWTGIVGTLQREDADLSLDLTITPKSTQVIQFTKTYIDESVVLLSSKPRPLPEYLSLIRPFEC